VSLLLLKCDGARGLAFDLEVPSIGVSDSSVCLINGESNAISGPESNVSAGAPSVGSSVTRWNHTGRLRTWHIVATVIRVFA
jgi:hypothetical protein